VNPKHAKIIFEIILLTLSAAAAVIAHRGKG